MKNIKLYPSFNHWLEYDAIYIISDTHFDDSDCKIMDPNWITPEEHIQILKKVLNKQTLLIHLGDVGNGEYLNELKGYKVLITGNHDILSKVSKYFDEVYTGPLFIADRILLSHEPIFGLESFAWNIHGHCHGHQQHYNQHTNLAANVYNYQVFNLGKEIKNGLLSQIKNYHRCTIDEATKKKQCQEEYVKNIIDKYPSKDFITKINTTTRIPIGEWKPTNENFIPEACRNCSNHPYNGGSGICHCTLGLPKITC